MIREPRRPLPNGLLGGPKRGLAELERKEAWVCESEDYTSRSVASEFVAPVSYLKRRGPSKMGRLGAARLSPGSIYWTTRIPDAFPLGVVVGYDVVAQSNEETRPP